MADQKKVLWQSELGRRSHAAVIGMVLAAMIAAILTVAAPSPGALAQTERTTCYLVNDTDGTMVRFADGFGSLLGETGLAGVEALASHQANNELWAYDAATEAMYVFTPGNADPTFRFDMETLPISYSGIDALTWVNHTNTDPTDDELWGTLRNGKHDHDNVADEIIRIDPTTGVVLSGPTPLFDPGAGTSNEQDDNDGLVWDPQTGNLYGVTGGDTSANDLTIIDRYTGDMVQLPLTLDGGIILDIESLGVSAAGQIIATTGSAGNLSNHMMSIDKITGEVTLIGEIDAEFGNDYEAAACLTDPLPVTVSPSVCFAIDEGGSDGDGAQHLTRVDIASDGSLTVQDHGQLPNANNIENLAFRNGPVSQNLYAFDPATNELLSMNHEDGRLPTVVATIDAGDIDAMTWRFDNDADPSNDELWAVTRSQGVDRDHLIRIDPDAGQIISGPTLILTEGPKLRNDVDGLAWDPTTGLLYGVTGGGNKNGRLDDNMLITIGTDGAVDEIGLLGVEDVEGLGMTDDGQLFAVTGDRTPAMNSVLFIDKATGNAQVIGGQGRLFSETGFFDFEGLDCAGEAPLPLQPILEVRLTAVLANVACPAWDGAVDGGPPAVFVDLGDTITYCINVNNSGPGAARNVTIEHTTLAATVTLGDLEPGDDTQTFVFEEPVTMDTIRRTVATIQGEDVFGNAVAPDTDAASIEVAGPIPTVTSTSTPVPTATSVVPTATSTPVPTATSVVPTATSTPVPTATSVVPTATSTPVPTATSVVPTATSTPVPTATSVVPTATSTPVPTATATPAPLPVFEPAPPTAVPTDIPTEPEAPTPVPPASAVPTPGPTDVVPSDPDESPTVAPTEAPTSEAPTPAPTEGVPSADVEDTSPTPVPAADSPSDTDGSGDDGGTGGAGDGGDGSGAGDGSGSDDGSGSPVVPKASGFMGLSGSLLATVVGAVPLFLLLVVGWLRQREEE